MAALGVLWGGLAPAHTGRDACPGVNFLVAETNLTLQTYANKWHVYAGLAILNPSMCVQIDQLATHMTEHLKLMLVWGGSSTLRRGGAHQRGGDVSQCLCGAGHIQRGWWHV